MTFKKLDFTSNATCPRCNKAGFRQGDWYAEIPGSAFMGTMNFRKMHIDCWLDENKEALIHFKWIAPKVRRQLKSQIVGEHI